MEQSCHWQKGRCHPISCRGYCDNPRLGLRAFVAELQQNRQIRHGNYLRRQQSCTRQESTYQHHDQRRDAPRQKRLHHPQRAIRAGRSFLQEMDTEKYHIPQIRNQYGQGRFRRKVA